jgi:hypothetical protein
MTWIKWNKIYTSKKKKNLNKIRYKEIFLLMYQKTANKKF